MAFLLELDGKLGNSSSKGYFGLILLYRPVGQVLGSFEPLAPVQQFLLILKHLQVI